MSKLTGCILSVAAVGVVFVGSYLIGRIIRKIPADPNPKSFPADVNRTLPVNSLPKVIYTGNVQTITPQESGPAIVEDLEPHDPYDEPIIMNGFEINNMLQNIGKRFGKHDYIFTSEDNVIIKSQAYVMPDHYVFDCVTFTGMFDGLRFVDPDRVWMLVSRKDSDAHGEAIVHMALFTGFVSLFLFT